MLALRMVITLADLLTLFGNKGELLFDVKASRKMSIISKIQFCRWLSHMLIRYLPT